jgi:hypothetical protein
MGLDKRGGKMLLKYRIIFYAIILCLFGLTLMTVFPVFAQQGSGGGFFLCGTMDVSGWSAELTKDQYEECIKAVKAGENDSRLRGEPLLMEHRVICPPSFPDLCQRLELKKEDPRSIFYGKNYLHIYKLIDRRYNIH